MIERKYELTPRDVLFFRDGRPMDADKAQKKDVRYIGHGATWPRPDHLFKGAIHALLRETPNASFGDFPALKVMGPYPVKREKSHPDALYLPRPLDWDMSIGPCTDTDLPLPLEYGFIDRTEGKKNLPAWINIEDFLKYLDPDRKDRGLYYEDEKDDVGNVRKDKKGNPIKTIKFPYSDGNLFGVESRIGTTLDTVTGASKRVKGQHASGQYQGEYLRLQGGVSMWCAIETGKIGMAKNVPDAPELPCTFVMGGQSGIVVRQNTDIDLRAKFPAPRLYDDNTGSVFVRWTLISPALFCETGWLPGWCKDSRRNPPDVKPLGTIMFPDCEGCSLVGACTGKPIVFSGWDPKNEGSAKPTMLAVPQGSVYLFRCNGKADAEALIKRIHLQRQSDYGPQGFGIGVCSIVKPDSVLTTVGQGRDNG